MSMPKLFLNPPGIAIRRRRAYVLLMLLFFNVAPLVRLRVDGSQRGLMR